MVAIEKRKVLTGIQIEDESKFCSFALYFRISPKRFSQGCVHWTNPTSFIRKVIRNSGFFKTNTTANINKFRLTHLCKMSLTLLAFRFVFNFVGRVLIQRSVLFDFCFPFFALETSGKNPQCNKINSMNYFPKQGNRCRTPITACHSDDSDTKRGDFVIFI